MPQDRDPPIVPRYRQRLLTHIPTNGEWVSVAQLTAFTRDVVSEFQAVRHYNRLIETAGAKEDVPDDMKVYRGRSDLVLRSLAGSPDVEHDGAKGMERRYRLRRILVDIPLDRIKEGERFRKDYGDLDSLALSMKNGLLQPIGIDKDNRLIWGARRVRAARILGWKAIPARVVDVDALQAEHDENEERKPFTASERTAIANAIVKKIGKRQGKRTDRRKSAQLQADRPEVRPGEQTRDAAAKAAGFSSAHEYRRASAVCESGNDELKEAMDSGEVSITRAAEIAKLPAEQQPDELAKARRSKASPKSTPKRDTPIAPPSPPSVADLAEPLMREWRKATPEVRAYFDAHRDV